MGTNASANGKNCFDVDIFMEKLNAKRIADHERSRHSDDDLYAERLHRIHLPAEVDKVGMTAAETRRQIDEHELHAKIDNWASL